MYVCLSLQQHPTNDPSEVSCEAEGEPPKKKSYNADTDSSNGKPKTGSSNNSSVYFSGALL